MMESRESQVASHAKPVRSHCEDALAPEAVQQITRMIAVTSQFLLLPPRDSRLATRDY
jgi:hypothetical protein